MKLPYLCACVKEAMRLHPSVGLVLPRHVPAGGCGISGHFFPQGTTLRVNAAVLHHETPIYGKDAADFNPERWFRDHVGTMDSFLLTFGAGARTCIGKNVSSGTVRPVLPGSWLISADICGYDAQSPADAVPEF